ncbi:hypothetical protein BDZ89DRAFT_1142854 [Hymenopellis radicata]|nr:hypothetical protein BDZ89DRAFT_1142854 [Hymenopellis radicata]
MDCLEFRQILEEFDMNFFQETHLRPAQDRNVRVPDGYSLYTRVRTPGPTFDKVYGGVAAVVRSDLRAVVRDDLSGVDFMALQINDVVFFNVYILPETSSWCLYMNKDPEQALASAMARAREAKLHAVLAGDPNAHTADLVARPEDPPRVSSDMVVTKRGRWLTALLRDCDMEYLNGTSRFAPSSERCTFFRGESVATVIDYVACSSALVAAGRVPEMSIDELAWSDHAALHVTVKVHITPGGSLSKRKRKAGKRKLQAESIEPSVL